MMLDRETTFGEHREDIAVRRSVRRPTKAWMREEETEELPTRS
jgi:hypothetical protein